MPIKADMIMLSAVFTSILPILCINIALTFFVTSFFVSISIFCLLRIISPCFVLAIISVTTHCKNMEIRRHTRYQVNERVRISTRICKPSCKSCPIDEMAVVI